MIKGTKSDLQTFFRTTKFAYNQVFNRDNQYTDQVLRDLARFCRAHQSTFDKDPRIQANLDGRREVWLKIQNYLQLTNDEVYALHNIKDT